MKIQELKTKVYELSSLNTIPQLKAKYSGLKVLDMRKKSSWEVALEVVRQQENEFEQWLENPPEEYKDLFSEITKTSYNYDRKSAKTKQLVQEVLSMSSSIEDLSEEFQEETSQLLQSLTTKAKVSEKSKLN